MAEAPFVSVIIPAHNEAVHVRECLQSFRQQEYPHYEVILVDNGSTDDTAAICREFPEVRYVYFDARKSSYAARNRGVQEAKGEVLVFFDADQTAKPSCLKVLLAEYCPGETYHVYAGRLMNDPRIPEVLREHDTYGCHAEAAELQNGEDFYLSTSYVALPRKLFQELGGFKEYLLSGGDSEFFLRAARLSQIHRCHEVGGYHYFARAIGDVLGREERMAFGACLRAREEGRKVPSVTRKLTTLVFLGMLKSIVVISIPFRFPKREWKKRWNAQLLHWLARERELRGIVKYKLGFSRAGDLPKDASCQKKDPREQTEKWETEACESASPPAA
jgi:glycosyltransferase involved in cell wall biosynthesis